MYLYPISVKSKQHLFSLDITQSFIRFPEVYFQIHLMEDDSVQAFWRTALSRDELCQVCTDAITSGNAALPLRELSQTQEYYIEMEKVNPLQCIAFSKDETQSILKSLRDGLPKYYRDISGCDGHSFNLTVYGNHPQNIRFWCYVRPELAPIAAVINLLVSRAGFDTKFYGIKVENE